MKDAYTGLKTLIQRRFANTPKAEAVLADYESDPETWEKPLKKSLIAAGVDKDAAIVEQAQQVLKLINPQQASQGKYNVQIGAGKGIVLGDDATVTQTFGDG